MTAASLASGWVLVRPGGLLFTGAVAAGAALVTLARWSFGAFTGVIALAVLNGIPGVDLDSYAKSGSFRPSDLAVALLVVGCALAVVVRPEPVEIPRWVWIWSAALLTWWLFTIVRSYFDGIPVAKAGLFGRDFLYFTLLLPALFAAFRRRTDIAACLVVLAAGGALYAFGQLATSFGATAAGGWFVHATTSNEFDGFTRIYAYMGDMSALMFPIALGVAIIPPRRGLRPIAIVLVLLSMLSVLFSFTRTTYLALAVSFIVVNPIWMYGSSIAARSLRRAIVMFGTLVVLLMAVSGYSPLSGGSAAQTVSTRAESSLVELTQRTGTVGYRYSLSQQLVHILGHNWPAGLGFLHPDVHPFAGLPQGSIRNTDVGVLNAVMTMGVVGTILLYVPMFMLLGAIFRRRIRGPQRREEAWIAYGAAIWILYVLASSVTLVTLFSVPGLTLTAVVLASTWRLLERDEPEAEWSPSSS